MMPYNNRKSMATGGQVTFMVGKIEWEQKDLTRMKYNRLAYNY